MPFSHASPKCHCRLTHTHSFSPSHYTLRIQNGPEQLKYFNWEITARNKSNVKCIYVYFRNWQYSKQHVSLLKNNYNDWQSYEANNTNQCLIFMKKIDIAYCVICASSSQCQIMITAVCSWFILDFKNNLGCISGQEYESVSNKQTFGYSFR